MSLLQVGLLQAREQIRSARPKWLVSVAPIRLLQTYLTLLTCLLFFDSCGSYLDFIHGDRWGIYMEYIYRVYICTTCDIGLLDESMVVWRRLGE